MAKIPLPELGQPLDVSYIYQLANAINELSLQVSPAIYKYVSVDVVNGVQQNAKASETRIIAGYADVVKSANQSIGSQKPFTYNFPADFKFAPIVTATPVNIGGTEAGKNVSVVIKSITTSKVDGTVNFNSTGDVSIGVNLIIVGIPN
jgi:hypothetical protein